MTSFALSRLAQAIPTLVAVSAIVFVMGHATGDPAALVLPPEASASERAAFRQQNGLDRPLIVQYAIFLNEAARGNFGNSIRTGGPVMTLVLSRLRNSLRLATVAVVLSLAVSVPLGVAAAAMRGSLWDRLALGFSFLGQASPPFFIAIVSVLLFAVLLGWVPAGGAGSWKSYILPSLVLAWTISAGIARLVRSSMLETLDTEYVKFARLKGLAEPNVLVKHALLNALIPVVTFTGLMYGTIIASAVTVEVVFAWPGLGQLAYQAILWRDFPVLQATVLMWTVLIIVVNFIVDAVYFVVDPRIRG